LGDDGTAHSPIYGFAADGYPIHGPWASAGQTAQSCWAQRDYDDPNDPLGCGGIGERSCVLVDPWDASQGTEPASSPGPDTSETVTSLSGKQFPGTDGLYFQDFYHDEACSAAAGALDEHNGHTHDGHGYHYHVTFEFPFTMGPTLYGNVVGATSINCGGVTSGGGGPPPN